MLFLNRNENKANEKETRNDLFIEKENKYKEQIKGLENQLELYNKQVIFFFVIFIFLV